MREDLVRELRFLGIAEDSWPVLAMLPLIQVAWADGTIQNTERELILKAAREFRVDEEGERLLDTWLTHVPTEHYMVRGREALRLLAGEFPELARIDTVLELAQAVAKAAGGLFGFRQVDLREAVVLKELTERLSLPAERRWDWGDLEDDDDDIPASESGPTRADDDEILEMGEADLRVDAIDTPTITVTFQSTIEPRSPDGARLIRKDLDQHGPLRLPVGGVTIGRSRACDVWIQSDAKISRHHARLYLQGDAWRIQDNASTTGTWVNEERVIDRRLFGGETLAIGDVQFAFELGWGA